MYFLVHQNQLAHLSDLVTFFFLGCEHWESTVLSHLLQELSYERNRGIYPMFKTCLLLISHCNCFVFFVIMLADARCRMQRIRRGFCDGRARAIAAAASCPRLRGQISVHQVSESDKAFAHKEVQREELTALLFCCPNFAGHVQGTLMKTRGVIQRRPKGDLLLAPTGESKNERKRWREVDSFLRVGTSIYGSR